MPDGPRTIVTNTTPLIALAVATDGLEILRTLYDRVIVPLHIASRWCSIAKAIRRISSSA
jgi:predicted nucleic acid-binding protein